jgi:hypothetical protein
MTGAEDLKRFGNHGNHSVFETVLLSEMKKDLVSTSSWARKQGLE